MKKVLSLILALAMVFALVACGEKQPASDGDASGDGDKPARGNVIMTFGTADTGGSMYPAGAAVSQVVDEQRPGCEVQHPDLHRLLPERARTSPPVRSTSRSPPPTSFSTPTTAPASFADIGKLDNLRVIGAVYTSVLQRRGAQGAPA